MPILKHGVSMKLLKNVLVLTSGLLISLSLNAKELPYWGCQLTFKADSAGKKIIVGEYKLEGEGKIVCKNRNKDVKNLDVVVSMTSDKIAPVIALGKYSITGKTGMIHLFEEEPTDLFGNYQAYQSGVAAKLGVHSIVARHEDWKNVSLMISVMRTKGMGLVNGLTKLTIEPAQK